MAFPGIISRLHPVSSTEELAQQRLQGEQYRAEAFWLPASMHSHASEILAALRATTEGAASTSAAAPTPTHS